MAEFIQTRKRIFPTVVYLLPLINIVLIIENI